jgi:glycosyltransferase involved in cell wall biosynthesis
MSLQSTNESCQDRRNTTIIIPAYNEAGALRKMLDTIQAEGLFQQYAFLVVDDGSTDGTADVASTFPLTVVRHSQNRGYGAALKTGIRAAKTDRIIFMDSDGQHEPREISNIAEALDGADLVIGERDKTSFQVANRKLGKRIIRWVAEYLLEQKIPDYNSGFRGMKRHQVIGMLHILPNGFSLSTTTTLGYIKHGYNVQTVPIHVTAREGRPSTVKFFRDGARTLLLICRIVMLFNPMKMFLPASLAASAIGALWSLFGIILYGRMPNTGTLLLTLGMLLFFIGLLADQVSMLNLRERETE